MAKKIRFPLQMNGTDVRTIEELRENFDLESVLGYFINGKLVTWLRDHYYDNEAKAVEALSVDDSDFNEKIASILGVCMSEDVMPININDIQRRTEKIALLRQLTDDEDLIAKVDAIAFNQEDLDEIQKNGTKEIYLCKGHFTVLINQTDFVYNSLFNPTITIREENAQNNEAISISMNGATICGGEDFQYQVGLRFYQGDGVEKDYKRAFELFSKSAANGNIEALVKQGICYYYGRGVPLNYAQAVDCFKKGIKAENKEAYFWLGKCYLYGYVPNILCWCQNGGLSSNQPYNVLLAFYCFCKSKNDDITKWYMRMCDGIGSSNSFGSLGIGLIGNENSNWLDWQNRHDRIVSEIKEIDVEQLFINLINQGDIDAEFELGRLYFYGVTETDEIGVPQNFEKAQRLINDAAENNQSAAQYWLGFRKDNLIVTWLSEKEKLEWCKQSYLNGCIYAATYLWLADFTKYQDGAEGFHFLSKDLLAWYTVLANSGNKYAQYVMYRLCNDKKEMIEWLKKSAENNYALAQYKLAWVFRDKKDIYGAIYWYTKAAEQGYSGAAWSLGSLYSECDKYYNREKALKFTTIGAELGSWYAMYILKSKYGIEDVKPINRSRIYFKEHLDVDIENITID